MLRWDISSNRERTKVQKILEGYGFRIQKSVYECSLSIKMKKEVIRKLEKVSIKTGFIKFYRYDRTVKNKIIGVYKEEDNPDGGNAFIV